MNYWLAVAIGNSRIHWALFKEDSLIISWDTEHLHHPISTEDIADSIATRYSHKLDFSELKVVLASVVPTQTAYWQQYPHLKVVTLADIPLKGIYPTMGIDRALALYGAAEIYGYPCLVIDGGTALTFTGVDRNKKLIGGAIVAGLRSQIRALSLSTAALPQIQLPDSIPSLWATNTNSAIASGIVHTLTAAVHRYIHHWQQQYPDSSILITGGDSKTLLQYLQQLYPDAAKAVTRDSDLIFWGMQRVNALL